MSRRGVRFLAWVAVLTAGRASEAAPPEADWPRGIPTDALLSDLRRAVEALGVYRATVTKTERVRGRVMGPETADVWVREEPRAVLMTFLANGRPGRRVLYNQALHADRMLVRERGLPGLTSIWVDVDGWLSRRATNHSVRDVGFGALVDLIAGDLEGGRAFGGHRRADEPTGQGPRGTTCTNLAAPAGARGLYATWTRLCFDRVLRLPVFVEVHDGAGFLERYDWRDISPRQRVDDRFFTPEGAGL